VSQPYSSIEKLSPNGRLPYRQLHSAREDIKPMSCLLSVHVDTMSGQTEHHDAGPSHTTHYPRGGTSKRKGGKGIFIDPETEEGIEVWVDTDLKGRGMLVRAIEVGPRDMRLGVPLDAYYRIEE